MSREPLGVLASRQVVEFAAHRFGELARDLGDVVALAELGVGCDEARLRDQDVQVGVDATLAASGRWTFTTTG